MKKNRYRSLFCLLLLAMGLILSAIFNPVSNIEAESVAIASQSPEKEIIARIYSPTNAQTPHPVMLLCHGVNNSKEMMAPLAVELGRNGIAAIAFDFGGYGESYPLKVEEKSIENLEANTLADAEAVLAYIRNQPERFDRDRIGVLGHSMGGATALELGGRDPELRSTIILGMAGSATTTNPANLFLGAGLYEQINPPSELFSTLQQATASNNPDCIDGRKVCGNFGEGTARKLVISPTADHIIEPYNPRLIAEAVNWARRSLFVSSGSKPPVTPWFICSLVLTFFGGVASGVSIFMRPHYSGLAPLAFSLWRRVVTWLLGFLMVTILLMANSGLAPTRSASNTLLFCYVLQLLSNYGLREPQQFQGRLRAGYLYASLLIAAFLLPTLLCGLGEILRSPAYLLSLPQFLLQWPIFAFYNYGSSAKLFLIPAYTMELQVSWFFAVLVLVELFSPGLTFKVLGRAVAWGIKWLRRPWNFTGVGIATPGQMALIGTLAGVLGVVWYWRFADGLVAVVASKGLLALQMAGLFLFLPVAAMVLGMRSPWFRRLEEKVRK